MNYLDKMLKLAEKLELIIKEEKDNSKELLNAALKHNKGKGIQVYYNGQHFGWYKWNAKKNKHEQFSIGDFDPNDKISDLGKELKDMPRVDLEVYLPEIAGRKQT